MIISFFSAALKAKIVAIFEQLLLLLMMLDMVFAYCISPTLTPLFCTRFSLTLKVSILAPTCNLEVEQHLHRNATGVTLASRLET